MTRIDLYLHLTLNLNKKEIHEALHQGKVKVNDQIIYKENYRVQEEDHVYINNHLITKEPFIYIMLNKPKGVISATKDQEPTVLDLIHEERKEQLMLTGRLDKDTTGLMLLTNNKQLIRSLTSPEHNYEKEYAITLKYNVEDTYAKVLEEGIVIDHNIKCKPAKLIVEDNTHVHLIITEGKFHQVKKMFKALGNEVMELHRVRIHHLVLDDTLPLGAYRYLTKEEIEEML